MPGMIWGTNYTRLVSQTVFTLFFAGRTFAPKCIIDGVNIQEYLQTHFIDAVGALAKRISEAGDLYDSCVIGWDSMNEPGEGLVGWADLGKYPAEVKLRKGPMPTPIEGMRLGMGEAVDVANYYFGAMGPIWTGNVKLDPKGTRLWLQPDEEATRGGGKWGWKRGAEWEMGTCCESPGGTAMSHSHSVWAQHGVWDISTGRLLRPDYFAKLASDRSHSVDFVDDFWLDHWKSYSTVIRQHHPEAIHFIQAPVLKRPPCIPQALLKNRAAGSPHYYDGLTLMTKHWNWFNADAIGVLRGKYWSIVQSLRVGEANIRKSIQEQLGLLKTDTSEVLGQFPTLVGEIGCPFDMDDKRAYDEGRSQGDYTNQQRAWDCSLNATDGVNCLNYTVWTYVPDNCHKWGDRWCV